MTFDRELLNDQENEDATDAAYADQDARRAREVNRVPGTGQPITRPHD